MCYMKNKFSIFTPVYNAEKYLRDCIESVLCQSLEEFEWYIYDDGSVDQSYDICKKLTENDYRVHLSRGKNGTSIQKMNEFIDSCKSEYVAFIDNDDVWEKNYLKNIYERLKQTDADCAITSYTLIDSAGNKLKWYTPDLHDGELIDALEARKRFLTTLEINGFRWNKFFKSDIYKKSKVQINNKFPADIPFEFKLLNYADKILLLNDKGYYYRQSTTSEIATINVEKIMSYLEIHKDVAVIAGKTLPLEAWYYRAYDYIDYLFPLIKEKKCSEEDFIQIFTLYTWNSEVGKSLIKTLIEFSKFEEKKNGHLKLYIKALVVFLYEKKYKVRGKIA